MGANPNISNDVSNVPLADLVSIDKLLHRMMKLLFSLQLHIVMKKFLKNCCCGELIQKWSGNLDILVPIIHIALYMHMHTLLCIDFTTAE